MEESEVHIRLEVVRLFFFLLLTLKVSEGTFYVSSDGRVASVLNSFNTEGQRVSQCPLMWNRYDYAWVRHLPPKMLTLDESRHRVLLSTARAELGDGLGHVLYYFNYELLKALQLNLTYTFRHNTYQSLTKNDEYAVDKFFGWGDGEIAREHFRAECVLGFNTSSSSPHSPKCHYCRSLSRPGQGALGMRHLVNIPEFLAFNCTARGGWGPGCDEARDKLLRENDKDHTIFQLPTGRCSYEGTNSVVDKTKGFFHSKYWNRHGRRHTQPWPHSEALERLSKIHFRETELNIAVHIRRGDFFQVKKRKMLKDEVYAKLVANVLDVITRESGSFFRAYPVVHIYSEGKKVGKGGFLHDTSEMDNTYYNENGVPRTECDWLTLIRSHGDQRFRFPWHSKLRIEFHISGDTLADLHNMVAADVFIGSESAMSVGLVRSLSRGVAILPGKLDDSAFECCTIRFDASTGRIHLQDQFLHKWRAYEAANGASLLRALQEGL